MRAVESNDKDSIVPTAFFAEKKPTAQAKPGGNSDNTATVCTTQGNVESLMAPLRQLLEQYTAYDLSSRPLMQLKIKALVLDLVHSMDVVDQLQK